MRVCGASLAEWGVGGGVIGGLPEHSIRFNKGSWCNTKPKCCNFLSLVQPFDLKKGHPHPTLHLGWFWTFLSSCTSVWHRRKGYLEKSRTHFSLSNKKMILFQPVREKSTHFVCTSREHLHAEIMEGEQKDRGALIGKDKLNKNRIQIN